MQISRKSINSGLAVGGGTAFIALIGMLDVFASRYAIAGLLSLSTAILAGVFIGAGIAAVRHLETSDKAALALNGAISAVIVVIVVAIAIVVATQLNEFADAQDFETVFPNVSEELVDILTFGQESPLVGYLILAVSAAIAGALGALSTLLPARVRNLSLQVILIIMVLGLLQDQVNTIISLVDAVWVVGFIAAGYAVGLWRNTPAFTQRLLETTLVGLVLGVVAGLLMSAGAAPDAAPAFLGDPPPPILASFVMGRDTVGLLILFALVGAALGAVGGTLSATSGGIHRGGLSLLTAILILGVLQVTQEMTWVAALLTVLLLVGQQLLSDRTAPKSEAVFQAMDRSDRRTNQIVVAAATFIFLLVIPQLFSSYINNVVDLIGLYIMMGLGLNIVVGYAGLLDLGYVAFFAIGAYMTGMLTTPNVITCGGISPSDIAAADIATTCTGITTFWIAWPISILTSGLAGVMLGIPVLRLRGDYLAIVTLGFGEIIRLVTLSDLFKPYFGGAQGIVNIPSPTIDFTGASQGMIDSGLPIISQLGTTFAQPITLARPNEIYYLILAGIIVTAFVSFRLSRSRLGRAWRAMKADEDVAQAMGINLIRTKLLAFSIGAAFSGVGGALFGAYLKSIFPNSFVLLISINVLSLIIIGGMGSIPGVFVGALVIFGLPEALREFQEYRLLMFGALLVVMMLLRPEGIIPPSPPRLEDRAERSLAEERA